MSVAWSRVTGLAGIDEESGWQGGPAGGGVAPEAQSCILQERGHDWGISGTQSIQIPARPAPWESWGLPPAPTEAAMPSPLGYGWFINWSEDTTLM